MRVSFSNLNFITSFLQPRHPNRQCSWISLISKYWKLCLKLLQRERSLWFFPPSPVLRQKYVEGSKQASRPKQLKDRFGHNAIYLYNLINLPLSHLLCRCRNANNTYPYISQKTKQMAPRNEDWGVVIPSFLPVSRLDLFHHGLCN